MVKKFIKAMLISIVLVCILAMFSNLAFAVPALEVQQNTVQPSGEAFKSTLHGDEWLNWRTTDTDDVVVKDDNGYWCYAQIQSGKLKAGDKKFKINQRPANALTHKDAVEFRKNNPQLSPAYQATTQTTVLSNGSQALAAATSPWNEKLLILLVSFNDVSIRNTDSTWSNSFCGTSGATVRNYYNEASGGLFYFAPAAETSGTANDGVIRVKLNYNHPNTGSNTDSRDQKIVSDALIAADPYINYASFDTNGDGSLSSNELHVVVLTAGFEASCGSSTPSVWGHSWATSVNLDGKSFGAYTMQGEYHEDHPATIGIFCHELGHSLGLPDLYDTDYTSNGIGIHSVMAGGSWGSAGGYAGSSPTHFDAWCKVKLGYYSPTVTSSGTYTLKSFDAGYNVVKIPTSKSNEYFLLENRRFVGYDAALQSGGVGGGGIAIWHIDESMSGNTNEAHKLVDLEEANQGSLGYSQLDTKTGGTYNHYYYSGSFTSFSNTTTPNSKLYDGTSTNISVSANAASSNSMNVAISNGSNTIKPYFMIVNKNSGKALDLIGGDPSNGARINQWSYDYNGSNQRWSIEPAGNGHYKIVSYVTGKVACVDGPSLNDGAQIHDWDYTGIGTDQQWDFVDVGNGWYKIVNVYSGKCLDVSGGSLADDAKVQQWTDNGTAAQMWRLQPWGDYNIKTSSGRYVCVENRGSTNGYRIIQYDYENNPWFKWRFENIGDGWYKVSSLNAITRCIDLKDASTVAAAPTQLWDYVGSSNQKVRIMPKPDGTFQFFFQHTGMAWDMPAGQTGNNVPLEQYPYNGNANQEFIMERVQ